MAKPASRLTQQPNPHKKPTPQKRTEGTGGTYFNNHFVGATSDDGVDVRETSAGDLSLKHELVFTCESEREVNNNTS